MKFSYKSKIYEFDADTLTVAEGREIKNLTGMTLQEWQVALESVDADAMAALVLTAVRREGGTIEWSDLDSMNLVDFANSIVMDNSIDRDALARGEVSQIANRATRRAAPAGRPKPKAVTAKK
jgi:hypothetical protein